MKKNSKIWVAGQTGLVGSALIRYLKLNKYTNLILDNNKNKFGKYKYDLRNKSDVDKFFSEYKPEYVFLAAAKVGGIYANDIYSGEIIYDNLSIQTNVINAAHNYGVKKLIFLGSSCIYPKFAKQPIKEDYLLSGPLEITNKGYAVAKIAGITMCDMYKKQYGDDFISVMPCNLYGINDNFDKLTSHVLPAMIRKFHEAKIENKAMVELWGSGTPFREFLFVDDLAEGLVFIMKNKTQKTLLNIGSGEDISINDLSELIKEVIGFKGKIIWDASKPDGTPKKLLDVSNLNNMGWKYKTSLKNGIKQTYEWFLENKI